jgi:predicted outer membrane repeat protein
MRTKPYIAIHHVISSLVLTCLLVFGQVGRASAGSIIYVKPGIGGANNGTSWANAYHSLQQALGAASIGNQIWVAKGTYKPTTNIDPTISFVLKDGVAVYGGFAGTETLLSKRNPSLNVTILSGDIGAVGNPTDNSYHVVYALNVSSATILDGFRILAGNADSAYPNYWGGGMYNITSAATLRNLIFTGNSSTLYGGGLFNDHGAPKLTNVTFSNNSAGQSGGGMYNLSGNASLSNVVFDGNSAVNSISVSGGALYNDASNPSLTNVTFNGNSVSGTATNNDGGAIFNSSSSPALTNVTFSGNSAKGTDSAGGAIYNLSSNPKLSNVTFNGNSAAGAGGAINNNGSNPRLTNATFSGNSAGGGGAMYNYGGSTPAIFDSIFWGDGIAEFLNNASSPILTDNAVQGGCPSGATCAGVLITANPMLAPLQNNGGFTRTMALGAGSPAIDAGQGSSDCAPKDQRGVIRPQGARCDMGAYEVRALSLLSVGTYDGQVLESGKATNVGDTANSTNPTLFTGDNALNRRYRGILSFDTSPVPDGATIVLSQLRVRKQGLVGNPFGTQGSLLFDLSAPYFGRELALVGSDYQALTTVSSAGTPFSLSAGGWYRATLNALARTRINKFGTTQFRLRFSTEHYNNAADYLSFYSGNTALAANRPLLYIYYNP